MLAEHDPDRFKYEDGAVDLATREEAAAAVALVAEVRERLMLEARAGAEQIRKAYPRLVERYEYATRAKTASLDEQVQGFVERVSDNFADFIDHDELRSLKRIAEGREE